MAKRSIIAQKRQLNKKRVSGRKRAGLLLASSICRCGRPALISTSVEGKARHFCYGYFTEGVHG